MERKTKRAKELPDVVTFRPRELSPLLELWKVRNPGTPLTYLITKALKTELRPLAGKQFAHLCE